MHLYCKKIITYTQIIIIVAYNWMIQYCFYVQGVSPRKDTHFEINITLKLMQINGFRKHRFVHLTLLQLCLIFYNIKNCKFCNELGERYQKRV